MNDHVASPDSIRFSLSELLIAFAALSIVIGIWSAYGLLGASIAVLVLSTLAVKLERVRQHGWTIPTSWFLLFISYCIVLLIMAGRLLLGVGPVYSPKQYPYELQTMVKVGGIQRIDARVNCLGSFIDREYVWRLAMTSHELKKVTAEYGLRPIESGKVPWEFRLAFPWRWRPSHNERSRYLSTAAFPVLFRGEDGDHYLCMYDAESKYLYVWCKSNF